MNFNPLNKTKFKHGMSQAIEIQLVPTSPCTLNGMQDQ